MCYVIYVLSVMNVITIFLFYLRCIKLLFVKEKVHKVNLTANNNNRCTFKIEERRRKVGSLLAQSMTETEIAQELNVDQSTISRDVKALKELSQQFIF
jgi:Trp operon repressor